MSSDRQLAQKFFNTEIRNLRTASKVVVESAAQDFKAAIARQLKANFKGSPDSRGFFKAIKVYHWTDKHPDKPPMSLVRMGIRFMHIFQEGGTVNARESPNLIIRLPDGARLGLPRANYKNWKRIYAKFGSKFKIARVANGFVVLLPYQGNTYAVYKIQQSVKIPKKLSFYEAAGKIANQMPERINKLMG